MKALCGVLAMMALSYGCTQDRAPAYRPVRLAPACAREGIALTIVGDSLARGWGATAPQHDFAFLVYSGVKRSSAKTTMRNLGIPGATTEEIARSEVPRIATGRCSLVVVISGANDVQKLYSASRFRTSYHELLRALRARIPDGGFVVMGLPDVSLSPRIPWFLKPMESQLSKDASASIAGEAARYRCAFVPLYALSHRQAYRAHSLLSADGIHPNDAGYRIMANAALPAIAAVLPER
jgi:lysophospholipase L1-like esterase